MKYSPKGFFSIEENNTNSNIPMANSKIKIKVNSQTFTATLLDNKSVKAFKEKNQVFKVPAF
jgi:hypothetical protein